MEPEFTFAKEATLAISNTPTNGKHLFYDKGEECGALWFENGIIKFKGKMDESAEAFFTRFKSYVDEYIEKKIKEWITSHLHSEEKYNKKGEK